jgi:hypothetical protein
MQNITHKKQTNNENLIEGVKKKKCEEGREEAGTVFN